jgi:hypothetical protein
LGDGSIRGWVGSELGQRWGNRPLREHDSTH